MNTALVFFATAIFGVTGTQATICMVDSDCGTGQCCFIKPAFEVVSKKRQSILPAIMPTTSDYGVCENYHVANSYCDSLETLNGHCGCKPGTSCQFVPVRARSSEYQIQARTIYYKGPGFYKCVAHSP
ncbi:uncharacterized protein LOC127847709 [Dreissena polymorpha]|uniref:Prokineticin domain-containing protein n=1 Tax=Dreissena polymorpha TaxID=45954 RepID=A0A9D4I2L4_DREPO|nr:uncharacterized protein LOC127847709 [Dreissena polymorpha]KAH3748001.1 hypothetical protein DPMN_182438 [Dreissena polymorpha]